MTLQDFLLLFATENFTFPKFNIINTNNNSFPKEFRRMHETAAVFFTELCRKNDPNNLLKRKIKYISLLPSTINVDSKKLDFDFVLDFDHGFSKITNPEINRYDAQHLCPAIHIVLKDEENEDV